MVNICLFTQKKSFLNSYYMFGILPGTRNTVVIKNNKTRKRKARKEKHSERRNY